MMGDFVNELVGAIVQVLLFALIPFIWWFITARKTENYFKWIGFKKIDHKGNGIVTILICVAAFIIYGFTTYLFTKMFSGSITSAGSQFAGKGTSYIPVAVLYGLIRTGLSEEILFRGFFLKRITNRFGFIAGNIIQSVLFGLMHGIPFGLASRMLS